MLHRILVPTDGSPESDKALHLAQKLAKAQGAEIMLLRAGERRLWPDLVVRRTSHAESKLEHALVTLDGSGLSEGALPLVHDLAGKPVKQVTLLRVVAETSDRGPAATYLDGVAARLAADGLQTQTRV